MESCFIVGDKGFPFSQVSLFVSYSSIYRSEANECNSGGEVKTFKIFMLPGQ